MKFSPKCRTKKLRILEYFLLIVEFVKGPIFGSKSGIGKSLHCYYGECFKISNTICLPKRPRQTAQIQIRLCLQKIMILPSDKHSMNSSPVLRTERSDKILEHLPQYLILIPQFYDKNVCIQCRPRSDDFLMQPELG